MLRDVLLPDLGLGEIPLTVGRWHLAHRATVVEGDTLLEVRAGSVLVDVPAPLNGRLHRRCVQPEESVVAGQRIAIIRLDDDVQAE